MIDFVASLAGAVAFFVGGIMAFAALWTVKGNPKDALVMAAVAVVCGFVWFAVPKKAVTTSPNDCWTDWDGRSNPVVCD